MALNWLTQASGALTVLSGNNLKYFKKKDLRCKKKKAKKMFSADMQQIIFSLK